MSLNWKKAAIVAVIVIVAVRYAAQIKGALAGVPLVNKVLG